MKIWAALGLYAQNHITEAKRASGKELYLKYFF